MSSVLSNEDYAIIKQPLISLRNYLRGPVTQFVTDFCHSVTRGNDLRTLHAQVVRRGIQNAIERVQSEDMGLLIEIADWHAMSSDLAFIEEDEQGEPGVKLLSREELLARPEIRNCLPSFDINSDALLSDEERACATFLLVHPNPHRPYKPTYWEWKGNEGAKIHCELVWIETRNESFVSALDEMFWPKVADWAKAFRSANPDVQQPDDRMLYLKTLEEPWGLNGEIIKLYQALVDDSYPGVIIDETTTSVWYQGYFHGYRIADNKQGVYSEDDYWDKQLIQEMKNPFFRLRDWYRYEYFGKYFLFSIQIPRSIDETHLITSILQSIPARKAIVDMGALFVLADAVARDYRRFQTQIEQMRKIDILWPLLTDLKFHKRLDKWSESAQQLTSELQRFRSAIQVLFSSGESDLQMVLQILRQDCGDFGHTGVGEYPGLTRDEVIKKWSNLLQAAGESRVSTTLEKALRLRLRRLEEELRRRDDVAVIPVATKGRPKTYFKYLQTAEEERNP